MRSFREELRSSRERRRGTPQDSRNVSFTQSREADVIANPTLPEKPRHLNHDELRVDVVSDETGVDLH